MDLVTKNQVIKRISHLSFSKIQLLFIKDDVCKGHKQGVHQLTANDQLLQQIAAMAGPVSQICLCPHR